MEPRLKKGFSSEQVEEGNWGELAYPVVVVRRRFGCSQSVDLVQLLQ